MTAVTRRARPSPGGEDRDAATPVVLALVLGAEERFRVRDAIRHRAQLCFVDRLADLVTQLQEESRPIAGVIVESVDRDQRPVAATVRDLRRRLPQVPVIGYCHIGPAHSAGIRALAAAGVHELMFHGVDDHGVALRAVLEAGTQFCAAELILERITPLVPPTLHGFVGFCLRYPHRAHTVSEVATALGVNRKTLTNYSARAGTLAPAELLAWCRLMLAAHFLATSARTVEAIAIQLDLPSDTALRNMMKRYTGLRAQEVRARGGLPFVLERLARAMETHRASAREAGVR